MNYTLIDENIKFIEKIVRIYEKNTDIFVRWFIIYISNKFKPSARVNFTIKNYITQAECY